MTMITKYYSLIKLNSKSFFFFSLWIQETSFSIQGLPYGLKLFKNFSCKSPYDNYRLLMVDIK